MSVFGPNFRLWGIFQGLDINSGVFREGHGAMLPRPFGPTMKIFYRRLYMKRCIFAIF